LSVAGGRIELMFDTLPTVATDGGREPVDPDPDAVARALEWWQEAPPSQDWLARLEAEATLTQLTPLDGVVGLDSRPGGELAVAVSAAVERLPALPVEDVVGVTAAAQRLMNWALALHLEALCHLQERFRVPDVTSRPGEDPADLARRLASARRYAEGSARSDVAVEVALACGLSEHTVLGRLHVAERLQLRLPATRAAVRAGDLDWPKAAAIVEATDALPATPAGDAAARAVEGAVLPGAAEDNPSRLRRRLKRAVIVLDPDAADRAVEQARTGRRVVFRPEPDGMASIWAIGPADRVLLAQARLAAMAEARREPADNRTADQRQLDVMLGLLDGSLAAAGGPPGPAAISRPPPAGTQVQVNVTVPLATLFGLSDEPAEMDGYGPIPPAMARDVAARGTWRCAVVDGEHGTLLGLGRATFSPDYRPPAAARRFIQVRDQRCTAPGCNARATLGDLDHRLRHPDGPTCECNIDSLCRKDHLRKHRGTLDPGPPGSMTWMTRTGLTYPRRSEALPTAPLPPRAPPGTA
jgi:hypothetical protein